MPNTSVTLSGLDELLGRISRLPMEAKEEVHYEVIDFVQRVSAIQKRKARKDQGGMVRGIGYTDHSSGLNVNIEMFANSEQSGYIEFGTKRKVDHAYIAKYGLQDVALAMKGPGIKSKLGPKEAIYAWCKRKSIEEKYWFVIFVHIMIYGISPKPFFYEPFFTEQGKLISNIEKIINENR